MNTFPLEYSNSMKLLNKSPLALNSVFILKLYFELSCNEEFDRWALDPGPFFYESAPDFEFQWNSKVIILSIQIKVILGVLL